MGKENKKNIHGLSLPQPITRSLQFPYFRVTAFSKVGFFLDTPFSLKLLFSEASFVILQTVSVMNSIPHCVIIFTFPWLWKTYGGSSDFRFSYYFTCKNWNYRLKYCQTNQRKKPCMHQSAMFACGASEC